MKLRFPVDALWAQVNKMGGGRREYSLNHRIQTPLPEIVTSKKGVDVTIDEVDTEFGLLSCNGAQVVLYIPDHGRNVDGVLKDASTGRRVHVADCTTLEQMRQKNRFQRYRAVVNVTGDFEVFGFSLLSQKSVEGTAKLQVCINCLKHLNYRGYVTEPRRQSEIRRNFSLKDFFAEHSTLFRYLPSSFIERKEGYAPDWPQISENFRASKGFHCESCRLDLSSNKYLLHTHHIDGNKRNNQTTNLQALCADCHRKQPLHDYMSIKSKDMALIQRLRKEQGILGSAADWDDLYKLVDPPYDGLLRYLKGAGGGKPEIGYEITDANGAVVAEVEIAWPHAKDGIVADDAEKKVLEGLGWKAKTLEVALREFREKR